jgi:hypothetical protein
MFLRITRILVVLALFTAPARAAAQTVTDERFWFNGTMLDKGGSDWHWSMETIMRSRNGVDDLDAFALRGTLGHDLTSRSSVAGGYGIALQYPASGGHVTEHRFFGQYLLRLRLFGGTLSSRSRMEDRWIPVDTGEVWRFREQVRYSHPIASSRWSITGYSEIFVHLNSSNRYVKGVDHVRAFGGVNVSLAPNMRLEAGYLNQFIPGHSSAPDRMNHVLSTTLQMLF